MDPKRLQYAIEDADRFSARAKAAIAESQAQSAPIPDDQVKTIRRLSLDVTHAMKDLRDSCDTVARTEAIEA